MVRSLQPLLLSSCFHCIVCHLLVYLELPVTILDCLLAVCPTQVWTLLSHFYRGNKQYLKYFTKITLTIKGEKAHFLFRYQRLQLLNIRFSEHRMHSLIAATSKIKSQ